MGKKYLDTKDGTLESSILGVWQEAAKKNEDKLDPVNKDAVKKDFDDRKDKDIDNDGDVDSTDKYLHKRRKAVSKAIAKEEVEVEESYELGTNEYRDHALDTTPGQSLTWGSANAYKQASMKEALAKVWGLDEKRLDKTEEDDKIAPVKGKKSMTGGKVADVDVDPEMKKEGK